MNVMQEIQNIRSLVLKADAAIETFIRKLENNEADTERITAGNYEAVYPITVNLSVFKGKKPTMVMFEDECVEVRNWKAVVAEIMRRCNADTEKHVALMNLRGRIAGRERTLLSKEIGDMRSPIKIDENLYIETNYDTETLLRTLMTRILDLVEYDYRGISVSIRNVTRHGG